MKILDLSAGNRAIWIEKRWPGAVFIDIRWSVGPDIVADSRCLPFRDGVFDLVVFDPPHDNFGRNSNLSKCYGWHTTEEIKALIKASSREAHRVTREGALMELKWNEHSQRLGKILDLIGAGWLALFGHQVASRQRRVGSTDWSSTFWVTLLRQEEPPPL